MFNNVVDMGIPSWLKIGKALFGKNLDLTVINSFKLDVASLWKKQVPQLNSLTEFVSAIEKEKKYATVIKYLERLANSLGIQKEGIYASLLIRTHFIINEQF